MTLFLDTMSQFIMKLFIIMNLFILSLFIMNHTTHLSHLHNILDHQVTMLIIIQLFIHIIQLSIQQFILTTQLQVFILRGNHTFLPFQNSLMVHIIVLMDLILQIITTRAPKYIIMMITIYLM